jgi:anti-anti-sigma factor
MVSVADGVVRVRGEVDCQTAPRLGEALAAVEGPLLVDLDEVTFMDSSGVNVLVKHYRQQSDEGAPLRVVAMSRCVHRILEVAGLLHLLAGDAELAS